MLSKVTPKTIASVLARVHLWTTIEESSLASHKVTTVEKNNEPWASAYEALIQFSLSRTILRRPIPSAWEKSYKFSAMGKFCHTIWSSSAWCSRSSCETRWLINPFQSWMNGIGLSATLAIELSPYVLTSNLQVFVHCWAAKTHLKFAMQS